MFVNEGSTFLMPVLDKGPNLSLVFCYLIATLFNIMFIFVLEYNMMKMAVIIASSISNFLTKFHIYIMRERLFNEKKWC